MPPRSAVVSASRSAWRHVSLLAFCALFAHSGLAAPPSSSTTGTKPLVEHRVVSTSAAPGEVRMGVYLYAVQDLDFPKHSFRASFNVWWRFRDREFDPLVLPNGEIYVSARVDAVIEHVFDTSAFPFGEHRLLIEIESPYETDRMRFVVDAKDSVLDPELYSPGWHIGKFSVHEETKRYPTAFGLPERATDDYSRIVIQVSADRAGLWLAVDYFIGFIVSALICLLTYLVHPRLLPARTTLMSTAVFAAVGNKYFVNTLTDSSFNTRLGTIAVVTSFAMVLVLALDSVACERMIDRGHLERALKTNRTIGLAALGGLVLVVLYVVWIAVKAETG
jgi:hypothetical protein